MQTVTQRVVHPCPISLLGKWEQFLKSRQENRVGGRMRGRRGPHYMDQHETNRDSRLLRVPLKMFHVTVSLGFKAMWRLRAVHSCTTDADVYCILYHVCLQSNTKHSSWMHFTFKMAGPQLFQTEPYTYQAVVLWLCWTVGIQFEYQTFPSTILQIS
jgi:hypothetical protein